MYLVSLNIILGTKIRKKNETKNIFLRNLVLNLKIIYFFWIVEYF